MKKIKFFSYGLAIMAALNIGLTGCGGGGSTSTSTSTSTGLVFPSDSVLAEPTLVNALKVTDAIIGDPLDNIPDVPLLNSVNNSSKMNPELLSRNVSKKITGYTKDINIDTYALNEVINEEIPCTTSGTISISGSVDATGGTITFTFNECNDGDDLILNGSVQASVSNLDTTAGEFKDMSMTFTTDLTLTDLAQTLIGKIVKGSYLSMNVFTFDIDGYPQTYKVSVSMQATDGTNISGIENAVYYYDETNLPVMEMYQTAGKIYIDNLASYVEYDTTYDMSVTPFIFLNGILTSGEVHYNMADGGKMKIVIVDEVVNTYVDADGDGEYEINDLPPV